MSMYEVVESIRPTPIGKPTLRPMIPVFATQIPVKDMLLKLLKTLI